MAEENLVFKEGDENCSHEWEEKSKDWEESPGTGPVLGNLPKWQFRGIIKMCKHCGREELVGGTVMVPFDSLGYYAAGEYTLEANGSRGLWIS